MRMGSYHRIPSHGQLPTIQQGAQQPGCRSGAIWVARSSLPLLLACLMSSMITYSVVYSMQQRAASAANPADRLDVLTGSGAWRQLPGSHPSMAVRVESVEALQMSAAARLLERDAELGGGPVRNWRWEQPAQQQEIVGAARRPQEQQQQQQPRRQPQQVAEKAQPQARATGVASSLQQQQAPEQDQQRRHEQQLLQQKEERRRQQAKEAQAQHQQQEAAAAAAAAAAKQQREAAKQRIATQAAAAAAEKVALQQQQRQAQQHAALVPNKPTVAAAQPHPASGAHAGSTQAAHPGAAQASHHADPAHLEQRPQPKPEHAKPQPKPDQPLPHPQHAKPQPRAKPAPVRPAQPPFGASGRMRVAVVNHAPYHLEIVAGWLHVLHELWTDVMWYQAPQVTVDGNFTAEELLETQGFRDILGDLPYHMVPLDHRVLRFDFVVFVSPEYYENQAKAFLERSLPISSLMLVHNGRNRAIKRLKALAPRTHVAALSPHVAAAARDAFHVDLEWAMATLPFKPKEPCSLSSINAINCLHGFAIQGNFEPQRRNYTHVWDMLLQHARRGELPTRPPLPPLHLHLIGRGDVEALQLPGAVKQLTTVHFGQRYPDYYEQIHHTHALVMALGSPVYLTAKMSSTVVTSLMTGVPVIADAAVLRAYTFLGREDIFPVRPGEDEVDTMLRVLRKSPAEIYRVHGRVARLAASLNERTIKLCRSKFMPLPREVANRHRALHIPYAESQQ